MKRDAQNPQAPASQPPRHGRRLIQMLFRPGVESVKNQNAEPKDQPDHDGREEVSGDLGSSSTAPAEANPARPPAVTGKFSALKRKLFPSQYRRHPHQVPPLVVSPINAPVRTMSAVREQKRSSSSPIQSLVKDKPEVDGTSNLKSNSRWLDSTKSTSQLPESSCNREEAPEDGLESVKDTSAVKVMAPNNSCLSTSGRAMIHDDDDMGLERAVEALDMDMESTVADKTLAEMNRAIEELQKWRQSHERETEQAMRQLDQGQDKARRQLARASSTPQEGELDSQQLDELELELKRKQQQKQRDAQALELRRDAEAYQKECGLYRPAMEGEASASVEQALQTSANADSTALSRLRDEIFQLDVKQRQAALLQDLEDAESAVGMNIVNVQAFTSELDSILAQFDGPSSDDAHAEALEAADTGV